MPAPSRSRARAENIGGDRNYDYRYAWVRDSSLALAILSVFGDLDSAERYMDWLAARDSATEMHEIHADVIRRGWSDQLQAFRQHYDGEELDALVLLLATMDFLPADDPPDESHCRRGAA